VACQGRELGKEGKKGGIAFRRVRKAVISPLWKGPWPFLEELLEELLKKPLKNKAQKGHYLGAWAFFWGGLGLLESIFRKPCGRKPWGNFVK
jgi:hypothetical protein